MKTFRFLFTAALLLFLSPAVHAQVVSNNNEDEVNKVDTRFAQDFVPGQVLVKFKDESTIQVRRANGKYRSASISAVDQLLQSYGVDDMEKLFPEEKVAKPKSKLRKRKAYNGTIVEEKSLDKVYWIKTNVLRPDSTLQLIEQLKAMDDVEYAEPNYYAYITSDDMSSSASYASISSASPTIGAAKAETEQSVICSTPEQNPLYSQQWGIKALNIDQLWDKPIINKKRPVIAILDTGVDINHPDLVDNIWTNTREAEGETAYDDDNNGIVDDVHGWNFVDNYYDLTDRNSHGTHVAGIAAAADNGVGIIGANPLAIIMPVKVMNDRGQGDVATICRGLKYAADNGADVINMSFGGELLSNAEKDALDYAYITSILVASSGNNGDDVYNSHYFGGTKYPAAYYLVLGVQATTSSGALAGFSNYDPDGPIYSEDGVDGRNYEIKAPGAGILSTVPDGGYKKMNGTSMSSPLFAGAVSALQMVKEYSSRDVLFGDLIHLNADFSQIYSDETPRMPKIDVCTINIDDSEGNNDGQVDVGETISFSPVLRNTWADATEIRLKLTVDEQYQDYVEIVNPEVDFGWSLSAYGRATAKTPIKVKLADNIGNNTRIKFDLETSYHENEEIISKEIYTTVSNLAKIGGLISSDTVLTADRNWLITSNIGIAEGVTLSVEPGTEINFNGKGLVNYGILNMHGSPLYPIVIDKMVDFNPGNYAISFVRINNSIFNSGALRGVFRNCLFNNVIIGSMYNVDYELSSFENSDIVTPYGLFSSSSCNYTNSGNHISSGSKPALSSVQIVCKDNIVNFFFNGYSLSSYEYYPKIIIFDPFPYLGTSNKDIARESIGDINSSYGFGEFDLSNMPSRPYAEAHGIVWKVVVNGYDAQDEFEDLAPLGVGRHKFEVYFNRPMNVAVAPKISFGVREPYTQHAVSEEGSWSADSLIYTAYFTVTGKTASDGLNRIYVYGAEDNEYFEIPYEKTRFNINIQAAGSMATGFAGEAGLGKVTLTWNNDENDFDDAMGFNLYRYTMVNDSTASDTLMMNKEIIDLETTEYIDYDVTPGTTYYYLYKVLSTDLREYDVSNTVAVTPLTSTKGDANGSGDVDVADVITTVNYAAGQSPKPFIFEAADMNEDTSIDILDVIGIIKTILNPNAEAKPMIEATATYTIEDGVVYVDTPVALAGVQVQVATAENADISVADDLKGFEHTSAWLSDNDYLFLAYNMNGKTLSPGKHALLYIGEGKIAQMRLSDADGHNVMAIGSEATGIDRMATDVMKVKGIYDLQGRKISGNGDMKNLPKGIYIVNGQKVVR
ncbi:MAG: S8 family serine peptidase [Prevotella sp.]|nr:S8 family serine peptidase [Prevotella sp.]